MDKQTYTSLIIAHFAIETGNTITYVEEEIFKKECNRKLFAYQIYDKKLIGRIEKYKQMNEMHDVVLDVAIKSFRAWSFENGIYLPRENETEYLNVIEKEIQKNKQYLK